jgi:hypothetical protein
MCRVTCSSHCGTCPCVMERSSVTQTLPTSLSLSLSHACGLKSRISALKWCAYFMVLRSQLQRSVPQFTCQLRSACPSVRMQQWGTDVNVFVIFATLAIALTELCRCFTSVQLGQLRASLPSETTHKETFPMVFGKCWVPISATN